MYEKCLSCPRLGVSCAGPRLAALPAQELLEWCRNRKDALNISNARLSEMSGIPKGTIDRIFSSNGTDFRYETIRIIVKSLVGGELGYGDCPHKQPNDTGLQDRMSLMEAHQHENLDTIHFLRRQILNRQRTIFVLSILLGIAVSAIICALVVDVLNRNIGFFWLH